MVECTQSPSEQWFPGPVPVLLGRVFQQLRQLQRVFADLLDRGEQEAVDGDVNHLLEEAAGLEEVLVAAVAHQLAELHAGVQVVVTVLRVDPEAVLLWRRTEEHRERERAYDEHNEIKNVIAPVAQEVEHVGW